ncbi:hypothetical protein Hanom_Chr07g00598101 [Helianthus anomalus]
MDLNRILLTHFTTFGSNIMFVSFYLQTLIHSFRRSLHSLSLSQIPSSLKFLPLISMETCYFQDLPTISTFLLFNLSSAGVMVVVRYITFPHILHLFFTHASMASVQQLYVIIVCNHRFDSTIMAQKCLWSVVVVSVESFSKL